MKKYIHILGTVLIFISFTACDPLIYLAKDGKEIMKTHKIIAILPFHVDYDLKNGANIDLKTIHEQEKIDGYYVQKQAQGFLLFKMNTFSVEIQEINKTNSILQKENISYDSLPSLDKTFLAKILGVDAILYGDVHTNKVMSEGAAVAIDLLTNFWAPTNRIEVNATIHNGADAKLLWQYNQVQKGGIASTSQGMTRNLMQDIAYHFPYRNLK